MNRGIALLGLVVVRTATARFLRGLAEHSPANVTAANYTRCVFERRDMVECHSTRGEELFSKDEAFAQCDADPECGAVQKWKKNIGEGKSTRYKLCSPGKDACGRPRLKKYERDGCSEGEGANSESEGGDCSVYRVFTCLPYDKRPAMRSGGLFALCIIMSFVCPLLICISTAAAAGAAEEGNPLILFCCPLVVFWILTFAFLSAYYGPAYNHSRDGACDPRVQPWGTHGAAIVGYGVIATGTLLCCIARPSLCCDDGCCVVEEREKDLWQACSKGDVTAVRRLLKKGADVNQATENGQTPLYAACQNGRVDAARLLLEKGAAVDRAQKDGATPLYIACHQGQVDAARLLLEKGADVNQATENGQTPLFIACFNGHVDAARLMLDKGAEVDRAEEHGTTPLVIACFNGHVDAARLMLDKGAEVDRATKWGTPLDIAQKKGHSSIVALLEESLPLPLAPPRPQRQQSEAQCSICLEPYSDRVWTKCNHSFCRECITNVCRTNPPTNRAPCPFCRQSVLLGELTSRPSVHEASMARRKRYRAAIAQRPEAVEREIAESSAQGESSETERRIEPPPAPARAASDTASDLAIARALSGDHDAALAASLQAEEAAAASLPRPPP